MVDKNYNFNEVLRTLRRIIRAIDIHSKKLVTTVGVTSPQLVVLKEIQEHEKITTTKLAEKISLSQSTVTTILDKLVDRQLVIRTRDNSDKRQWHLELSEQGSSLSNELGFVLPEGFMNMFDRLPHWQQNQILATLQHVAEMMAE